MSTWSPGTSWPWRTLFETSSESRSMTISRAEASRSSSRSESHRRASAGALGDTGNSAWARSSSIGLSIMRAASSFAQSRGGRFPLRHPGNTYPIMRETDPSDRVIVLGASAGGVESLSMLVAKLPRSLPSAVLAVLHMSADAASVLAGILDGAGPLPASFATERQPVEPGSILVAPPDRHLMIDDGHAVLSS